MTRLLPVFVNVLLPICVVVLIGFAGRLRFGLDPRPVTRLALYVLSPCLVFSSLVQSEVSAANSVQMALFATATMLSTGLVGLAAAGLRGLDPASRSAHMLVSMFPNAGNLGLAVVGLAFGEAGVQRAVIFFVTSAVVTNSLGVYVAASSAGSRRRALRQVASMPQIYALGAALLVRALALPITGGGVVAPLFTAVDLVADATIPVFLLVLGMQLTEVGGTAGVRDPGVWLATATRLVAAAPIAYGMGRLFALDDLSARVGMVEACMPAAVYCVILAYEFDAQPQWVTAVVVTSTLASTVTLTVLLSLLV
ncbi:MAG: AEC family transporter [Chloroflexota bacterium]|nr:AEC family transporter [Chloroflexota bacterium]